MDYDIGAIRSSINCESLDDCFDELSFEQIAEMCSYDIAYEGKVMDFIKGSIDVFKKFVAKVIGWAKNVFSGAKAIGAKIFKLMKYVKDRIVGVLQHVRFKKKEGADVSTEDIAASDSRVVALMNILNKYVGISVAQYVLGWKMINRGIFLKRRGWLQVGFLALVGFIVVASCYSFLPGILFGAGMLGLDIWSRNFYESSILGESIWRELKPFLKDAAIRSVHKRADAYCKRVANWSNSNLSDTTTVINEILGVTNWITAADMREYIKSDIKDMTAKELNDAFSQYSDGAIKAIKDAAANTINDKEGISTKQQTENMSTLTGLSAEVTLIGNSILKSLSGTHNDIRIFDFKSLYDSLHPQYTYIIIWT